MFNVEIITNFPYNLQEINNFEGVPQGNLLSPILSNIYLNELDQYIEKEIIPKYTKGNKAEVNKDYIAATTLTEEEKRWSFNRKASKRAALRKRARKKGLSYTLITNAYQRTKYIRYADDFIIGYRGPKENAIKIKEEIISFLKSNLHLKVNEEKTKLIDTYSNKAHFLGFEIYNVADKPFRKAGELQQIMNNKRRLLNRIKEKQIRMEKNIRIKVLENLRENYKVLGKKKYIKSLQEAISFFIPEDQIKQLSRKIYQKLIKELASLSFIKENNKTIELIKNVNLALQDTKEEKAIKKEEEDRINNDFYEEEPTITRLIKYVQDILEPYRLLFYKSSSRVYPLFKSFNIKYIPENLNEIPNLKETISELLKKEHSDRRNNSIAILSLLESIQKKGLISKHYKNNIKGLRDAYARGRRVALPPQIRANKSKIFKQLMEKGIISTKKTPQSLNKILNSNDHMIIRYFNNIAYGLLSYYRCSDNFFAVKNIVTYHLKFSLIKTLTDKHKLRSIYKAFIKYGENIKCPDHRGKDIQFIDPIIISNMKKEFLIKPINYQEILNKTYISFQNYTIYQNRCSIIGCENTEDIEIHHIRKLFRDIYFEPNKNNVNKNLTSIKSTKRKKLKGHIAMNSALKRKQIPLCKNHHHQ